MLVEPDGKILVDMNDSGDIRRLNTDGSPDKTFNPAGAVDTWYRPTGTARQPDGKRLVLANGVITRFNADGLTDTTFGRNGAVSSFYDPKGFSNFTPFDIAVHGKTIIVAGTVIAPSYIVSTPYPITQAAVERLNADGSIDRQFGMHYAKGSGGLFGGIRVTVAPDGTVYELGRTEVARFSPNGGDATRGSAGGFDLIGLPHDLLLCPNGRLLIVGIIPNYDAAGQVTSESASVTENRSNLLSMNYGDDGALSALLPTSDTTARYFGAIDGQGRVLLSIVSSAGDQMIRIVSDPGPTATVSGHVFADLNANGVQDPGEPPLAGARVFVDWSQTGTFSEGDQASVSNANGDFIIRAPGDSTVAQGIKNLIGQTAPRGWYRTFPADDAPGFEPSVVLSNDATITNIVFGDAPSSRFASVSGSFRGGGDNIDSWDVQLTDLSGNVVSDVTTDNAGRFDMAQLPPGQYILKDQIPPGWEQVSPAVASSSTSGGYASTPLTLKQREHLHIYFNQRRVRVGAVTGFIFNDTNNDGIQELGEGPLVAQTIAIDIASADEMNGVPTFFQETYQDNNGKWGIELPPGKYLVSAHAAGSFAHYHQTYPHDTNSQRTITIRGGQVIRNINFGYDAGDA